MEERRTGSWIVLVSPSAALRESTDRHQAAAHALGQATAAACGVPYREDPRLLKNRLELAFGLNREDARALADKARELGFEPTVVHAAGAMAGALLNTAAVGLLIVGFLSMFLLAFPLAAASLLLGSAILYANPIRFGDGPRMAIFSSDEPLDFIATAPPPAQEDPDALSQRAAGLLAQVRSQLATFQNALPTYALADAVQADVGDQLQELAASLELLERQGMELARMIEEGGSSETQRDWLRKEMARVAEAGGDVSKAQADLSAVESAESELEVQLLDVLTDVLQLGTHLKQMQSALLQKADEKQVVAGLKADISASEKARREVAALQQKARSRR